ncbi:hypothetical protein TSOC_014720, partial [Tetrabaena socialis]
DASSKVKININIRGTEEDPLFPLDQIGQVLGIPNISESLNDFDEDELRVEQDGQHFLTEQGLYRLLGQSRKPVARPFQKWVLKVLKDIRVNGRSEAEAALEMQRALVLQKEAELNTIRTKIYEELPKLDNVYVNKEVAELATDAHKIGKAIDTKKREAQLNTGSAQGSRMIHIRPTHNAKIVEDIVKVAQRRYHIASIGGWEHYNNNVEHSVDVIDIASTVVDTLASSFEYMTRGELFRKVFANLRAIQGDGHEEEAGHEAERMLEEEEDPRIAEVMAYLTDKVDFEPQRTAADKGKKCYAWLTDKELIKGYWQAN